MIRTNNYLIQAQQAKEIFLTYDQDSLIRKLNISRDEEFFYPTFFGQKYRLSRKNGDLEREKDGAWLDANTHGEVMTLMDLICDSREDRFVSGKWKQMAGFGKVFHQNLLEGKDADAEFFEKHCEGFRSACEKLGGKPIALGDVAYSIEVFDGLPFAIVLWLGDEEFPAQLRFFWDENALMYLKYETMYFAKDFLMGWLKAETEGFYET